MILATLLLGLTTGCNGNRPTEPCAWAFSDWDWDEDYLGQNPSALSKKWLGRHHYTTLGLPLDEMPIPTFPMSYGTGWELLLEPAGSPVLREAADCGANLAIPFNWALRLDNGQIESWGQGRTALNNGPSEGQLSISGSRPEDTVLALVPEIGDSTSTEHYFEQFDRDNSVVPTLGLRVSGANAVLTAFQLHPTETSTSVELFALQAEE